MSQPKFMARFVRVSNPDRTNNKNENYWEVWCGSDILAKFSVKELCNMNSSLDYDSIATSEFGTELIDVAKKSEYYSLLIKTFKINHAINNSTGCFESDELNL